MPLQWRSKSPHQHIEHHSTAATGDSQRHHPPNHDFVNEPCVDATLFALAETHTYSRSDFTMCGGQRETDPRPDDYDKR